MKQEDNPLFRPINFLKKKERSTEEKREIERRRKEKELWKHIHPKAKYAARIGNYWYGFEKEPEYFESIGWMDMKSETIYPISLKYKGDFMDDVWDDKKTLIKRSRSA